MENYKEIQEMLKSINELKSKYDKDTDKNGFNVFSALHKEHDEKYLHSRFISYLLSPNSNHGQGDLFLRKFINKIEEIKDFNLKGVSVKPNEVYKSEWENIDIYIENFDKKEAVIIENKIYAGDSNHWDEKGEIIPQLMRYYNTVKAHLNLNDEDPSSNIHLVYLTLKEKEPSYINLFKKKPILIDYIKFIPSWLEDCKESIDASSFLYEIITQYKKIVINLTNNYMMAMGLKSIVSDNLASAKCLIDNFNHVKWHTVHEFWVGLKKELYDRGYDKTRFYIKEETILSDIDDKFLKGIGIMLSLLRTEKSNV